MGRAKVSLRVRGKAILEFLLDHLAWPGPTLLVTAPGRERPDGSQRFSSEVCDPVAGEGPLRGVHTALANAPGELLVVIGVDMPAVTREDLQWYARQLTTRPGALVVMGSREGTVEPLPCALRRGAVDLVSAHLAAGRRSLHGLADDPRATVVDAGELPARVWLNVNT